MAQRKFARIITMKARPGKGDEFLKRFRDGVAASAGEIEGMRRLYLLRPVGKSNEFVAISLWDTKAAAEKYAKSGRNEQYGRALSAVQEGEEKVRKFDVEIHIVGERTKGLRE
jgi:heme-degrading monooxygenase HmoA